mmetsp:Transcript_17036/g.23838  ORF Transcript_17036/g.23838 Transcript_17036/m.23838 type:complete len:84 (+) Transcript_17036:1343-1594(+)
MGEGVAPCSFFAVNVKAAMTSGAVLRHSTHLKTMTGCQTVHGGASISAPCKPKVAEAQLAALGHENVCRFDIPMDNSGRMYEF